ncbi:pirin family protein [Candidatus Gracilibacteria bacterium]|nr:pirin family protein [Candidatus Gracilibacteria bacterium]
MKTTIHRSDTRGTNKISWLDSKHSFSFGEYYDTERMHFGALRVLNQDVIAPGQGFGLHPHENAEIVTLVLEGKVKHQDTMAHHGVIDDQTMQIISAGYGIWHSEHNASETEPLHLLQMWLLPRTDGLRPSYDQKSFPQTNRQGRWQWLVTPDGREDSLVIQQSAYIARTELKAGASITYQIQERNPGLYVFMIRGAATIANDHLEAGDALLIEDAALLEVLATSDADVLLFEVPMVVV